MEAHRYYTRGVASLSSGHLREAADLFRAAIQNQPVFVDAYVQLGKTLEHLNWLSCLFL